MNKETAIDFNNLAFDSIALLAMALDQILLGQYSNEVLDKFKRGIGIAMGKTFDLQELVYEQYPELDPDAVHSSSSKRNLRPCKLTKYSKKDAEVYWMNNDWWRNEETALSVSNLLLSSTAILETALHKVHSQCSNEEYLMIKQDIVSLMQWIEDELLFSIWDLLPEMSNKNKVNDVSFPDDGAANK